VSLSTLHRADGITNRDTHVT